MRTFGSLRHVVRPGIVALTLALALPLLACAPVERTVIQRAFIPHDRGDVRTVAWESNRYPRQVNRSPDDRCWGSAAVGGPVPDACLTAAVLASESDPFEQSLWLAAAGTTVAIATLVLVAWKRIAWQPVVGRTTAGVPPQPPLDPDAAVALMRHTEDERASRTVAVRRRRDISHPVLVGTLIPVAPLALLALVVGYGAAFGWALGTGLLLFVSVAIAGALVLLTATGRAETLVPRLLFLGGAAATLFVGSFLALLWRTPLLELNGVAWLF